MELFKKFVYQKLQEVSNLERGIEEALTRIVEDTNLQTAIKNYAIKNEICHKGSGEYGTGIRKQGGINNTFKDRRIEFWTRENSEQIKEKHVLYIGPDPNKKIMPMYLKFFITNDNRNWEIPECGYYNLEIEQKEPGKFYLEKMKFRTIATEREMEIVGRRVIDVPFLQGVPAREFLTGLEKAISKIIKTQKNKNQWCI